ncbi:hypothetical protein AF333_15810 [Aneurinibacillus migulanus]|uniref:Uncharacterized protein n=1 Tax=Aneurinibacillus migulanus TaxID=47500 RepID=A0A0M0H3R9_ANEMI|nr:hypothetical protein AF333_15810 [Aneurinibacillus migulanus]
MEGGDSEKRRGWMRPAIRQKRDQRVFFRPAHRPSFFSSLSPQEFVDVSNQMYIVSKFLFQNPKLISE